jgi:chromosome segregation ATPase
MTAKAGEADAALQAAQGKADAKDFVAGLEQMQTVGAAVDELDQMTNDPERAKYLAADAAGGQVCEPQPEPAFKTLEADWAAISQAAGQAQPLADSGDYAGANQLLADSQTKLAELQSKHDELVQQKQSYEETLAQVQPRLQAASVSEAQYTSLQPMQQEMATVQTQMESAAQAEDYAQALTQVQDLSTKLDALEQAKAEIDQQKQEYETALAALQPRIDAVSVSDPAYAKIEAQLQEIAQAQTTMDAAAQAGDYDQANTQLQDLSAKVDAYELAKTEIDQKKQEYETALATLQPRIDAVSVSDPAYVKIEAQLQEIAQAQTTMDAAAQAGDYDQANTQIQDLSAKVDAYEQAKAEIDQQKQEYETALAALQPRIDAVSVSDPAYTKIEAQVQGSAQAQTTMEASAQAGDYVQANTQLQDLTAKVDAYEQAKTEIDQQKLDYETVLAALQPKLPTTCPANAKLSTLDAEITTLKGQMEAAATSKDYAKALEVANQVSAKADEFQKALAEFEKNKQEYQAAVKALQSKLPTTCPVNPSLAERHSQVMALKSQMEGAASSQDYAKALELAKQLTSKLDAYQKALKETPPSPEKVKEVQDLINSGKKEDALQKAMEVYGVDKSQAKKIVYDPTLVDEEASTSSSGKVRVGDVAFSSPGWLASSTAHETEVHVNKQGKAGKWYEGTMGTAIQEVQAYDHELENAHKYNLSEAEIKELKKRRKTNYDKLNGDYKKQADEGKYDMKTGEEGL